MVFTKKGHIRMISKDYEGKVETNYKPKDLDMHHV